ncbi:hypothetical protein K466DRAFT_382204 [Polyporus arcularius HHB13444]|uniref:Uncharacterized protein n=1 Tax=Polyporus arcularius HHB13444 TaxID=1314778 RepID=A0A5C3NSA6_9APHY|nr:hypothetical protein K466DRAFT_382204 [Polyporus arcularius HHB13444]
MPPDWVTEDDYLLHLAFPMLGIPIGDLTVFRCSEPGAGYFESDRPFFREDSDIAVLTVHFSSRIQGGQRMEALILVIPIVTIKAALTTSSQLGSQEQNEARRDVRWSEWGPDGSRLLRLYCRWKPAVISALGSRVAIILPAKRGPGRDVYIVDVRPHSKKESFGESAREVPSSLGLGPPDGVAIDTSDTMSGLTIFAAPVTTRLPYRMTYVGASFQSSLMARGSLAHDGMTLMTDDGRTLTTSRCTPGA